MKYKTITIENFQQIKKPLKSKEIFEKLSAINQAEIEKITFT